MDRRFVVFCPDCRFLGSVAEGAEIPLCPKCDSQLLLTDFERDEWLELKNDTKLKIRAHWQAQIEQLRKEEEEASEEEPVLEELPDEEPEQEEAVAEEPVEEEAVIEEVPEVEPEPEEIVIEEVPEEEPEPEEPVEEVPVIEEVPEEEPEPEEPVEEEPVIEEVPEEEPEPAEPAAEGPVMVELPEEEPELAESVAEEPVMVDFPEEEPAAEEPRRYYPLPEEPVMEEPAEEPMPEEPVIKVSSMEEPVIKEAVDEGLPSVNEAQHFGEYYMYACPFCRKMYKMIGDGLEEVCPSCGDIILVCTHVPENEWMTYTKRQKSERLLVAFRGLEFVEEIEEVDEVRDTGEENTANTVNNANTENAADVRTANRPIETSPYSFFDTLIENFPVIGPNAQPDAKYDTAMTKLINNGNGVANGVPAGVDSSKMQNMQQMICMNCGYRYQMTKSEYKELKREKKWYKTVMLNYGLDLISGNNTDAEMTERRLLASEKVLSRIGTCPRCGASSITKFKQ